MAHCFFYLQDIYQGANQFYKFNNLKLNTLGASVQVYRTLQWRIEPLFSRYIATTKSPVNCPRELFKPSEDAASLLVSNEKKLFSFGFQVYYGWHHKWGVGLGYFGRGLLGSGSQP